MPTPVGHALGGLVVGLLALRTIPRLPTRSGSPDGVDQAQRARWSRVALLAAVACLPDIDFAWGRHNMETHSIGFAMLVGLAAYAWGRSSRVAVASALAVATHVLFDWLGSDDFPPLGVMALWPFSSEFYFANAFIFEAISRRYWLPGFVQHNLLAVLRELAILLPVAAAAYFLRRTTTGMKDTQDTKRSS